LNCMRSEFSVPFDGSQVVMNFDGDIAVSIGIDSLMDHDLFDQPMQDLRSQLIDLDIILDHLKPFSGILR